MRDSIIGEALAVTGLFLVAAAVVSILLPVWAALGIAGAGAFIAGISVPWEPRMNDERRERRAARR